MWASVNPEYAGLQEKTVVKQARELESSAHGRDGRSGKEGVGVRP
jgi:hypothetical protein